MMFPWKCSVHVKGITPMIIHNGRTASPLDEYTKKMKQITSKRQKTDDDIKALLEIQWESALYFDEEIGLHMPVENILAALLKAARKHKMGPKMSGFIFDEPIGFPIITEHHKDLKKLTESGKNKFIKAVTIQKSKTLSCRPIFTDWEIKFEFRIDEEILNIDEVKLLISTLSSRIGFGVWTPSHPKPGNHGRFLIKELKFENTDTKEVKKYENDCL